MTAASGGNATSAASPLTLDRAPRVVLITGGTSGIGLALAEAFIAGGDVVAVCGRNDEALARFTTAHPTALGVRADVTKGDDRHRLFDEVADQLGNLDVVINNAGSFNERDFTGPDALKGVDLELALNFLAPIQLTGEALSRWPALKALVFVTSGYALVSPARAPTYGAAKAGLHGFADGLRRQLSPRGTHVLEVLPPLVDTRMNATVSGKKLSTVDVAGVVLDALARRKPIALPGASRMLPTLLRIAPKTTHNWVSRS
jgi:uncharacterized oxidoreductase